MDEDQQPAVTPEDWTQKASPWQARGRDPGTLVPAGTNAMVTGMLKCNDTLEKTSQISLVLFMLAPTTLAPLHSQRRRYGCISAIPVASPAASLRCSCVLGSSR
jgi:hypothetical protein